MNHAHKNSLSVFEAAKHFPDRVALLIEGKEITYLNLAQRVARVMGWLYEQGVNPNDGERRIAVVAERDLAIVSAVYALIEWGVPIVFVHPKWTGREREQAIHDAQASLVIDESTARLACERGRELFFDSARAIDGELCMAILFTSGTSGRSKGVMLSRRAFLSAADASAENLGWQPDDRWLLNLPLSHVGGLSILIRSLIARACVVFGTPGTFEVDAALTALERDHVSLVSWVPTMLERILRERPHWTPPKSLRAILLGGSAARSSLLENAAQKKLPVLTTYGMTEACSQITCQSYRTIFHGDKGVGVPLRNVEVTIKDDQEVYVRGPTLMSGYIETNSNEHSFSKGDWFPTGDLGMFDDQGHLHILGRRDDRIVTGGENVDPQEVEQALTAVPGIAAACVFGVKDETWGEVVTAAVVLENSQIDITHLRSTLKTSLASYKVPKEFRVVERLPLTPSGKPDRAHIIALYTAARSR